MSVAFNVKDKISIPVEEAYKVLRTNIQFYNKDRDIKTVAITSYGLKEGKTTTSINLAISMAKSGVKVLLVDADLRKPMMLKHLSSNNEKGLSNYLSGKAAISEIINSTNIKDFFYVACGPKPPNPAELIGSDKFKEFISTAKTLFDILLIDTPPLGIVIDSAIIAAEVDAAILVIKANTVAIKDVKRAKEQLDIVGANLLGVVLNKVSKSEHKSYFSKQDYQKKVTPIDLLREKIRGG